PDAPTGSSERSSSQARCWFSDPGGRPTPAPTGSARLPSPPWPGRHVARSSDTSSTRAPSTCRKPYPRLRETLRRTNVQWGYRAPGTGDAATGSIDPRKVSGVQIRSLKRQPSLVLTNLSSYLPKRVTSTGPFSDRRSTCIMYDEPRAPSGVPTITYVELKWRTPADWFLGTWA